MKLFTFSTRPTDNQLVERCQAGEARAQRELYERFGARMMGVCRRYIDQTEVAEEMLSNGFIKCFQYIGQFGFKGSFEGWLRKIMVRECLSYLKTRDQTELYVDSFDPFESHTAYTPDIMLDADDLLRLIDHLPQGYKTVFNLYAIEGYKHQEIAEMLGISENTSKTQLMRARDLLQRQVRALEVNLNLLSNKES